MRMSPHFQIHPRHAFSALVLAGLAAVSLQTQAQALLQGPLPGIAGNGANATVPALAAPTPNALPAGLVQAPVMPQRPDLGAADSQRNTLTPLRAPKPQAPSQFQRFVQDSTGKLLPHFGAQLFENPLAYAADAAAPAAARDPCNARWAARWAASVADRCGGAASAAGGSERRRRARPPPPPRPGPGPGGTPSPPR